MNTPARRAMAVLSGVAVVMVIAWFNFHSATELRKEPVDEDKPAIAGSLAEDGRIGKISDAQGVIVLKPILAQRWTSVGPETLLMPGDWLRADVHGANAAKILFLSGAQLTIGPGTLIECISSRQARLHTGEAQISLSSLEQSENKPDQDDQTNKQNGAEAIALELLGPRDGGHRIAAPGKIFLRVDRNEKLAEIKDLPPWLAGFESTTSNSSLGSLLVNLPGGRNEPLSVGYHKVSVEIRDQIARTTVEESFVNHTGARLEGVFHFPLPSDASVSGFGMWIGEALTEADVVEKQRAREIYETILRERRDPGLLEWNTGNEFKARVFPIEGHSEKRVKLVYTQVLPLRANSYRYTYGLRSDLLRANPARELSLNVTVNSALPIKNVRCPTHPARMQQTPHSAQVEFAAQEYTPDHDFEVVCEIDRTQSELVVVPHRRGSDGYLLLQLTPPAPEGNRRRELLADGPALNVVLLCDTSGSIDSEKRRHQADFVAAVLSSLGEDDRFMLAASDVATAWAAPKPLTPTADNVSLARDFLEKRASLGWTDLDQAFEAVLQAAPAGAHVIYIGDGIVSNGDHNPVSFVNRLTKRWAEKQAAGLTLHSVTVGNTGQSTVMQGIATAGGGSTRTIGGERTAAAVALELLSEIAQPGLRDLEVEFRGVKVAAVYPERLANLAAGTQQILVARYLPNGKDQQGEIVVTGRRGAESVRYASKVGFPDAEEGNSFIPRLWARSHLDHLLAQGDNPAIRNDIVALSQEFHIITPYTSLLVLESDADRARFGVKRHFEMRDGEGFFAAGKADANFALAQQQAKRTASWRSGLREKILRELSAHDRDARMFRPAPDPAERDRHRRQEYERTPDEKPRLVAVDFGLVNLEKSNRGDYSSGYTTTTPDVNMAAAALGMIPNWYEMHDDQEAPTVVGGGVLGAGCRELAGRHRRHRQSARDTDDDDADDDQTADAEFDQLDQQNVDERLNVNTSGEQQPVDDDKDTDTAETSMDPAEATTDDAEAVNEEPADKESLVSADPATSTDYFQDLHTAATERRQMAMGAAMSVAVDTDLSPRKFGFPKVPAPPKVEQPGETGVGWPPEAIALSQSLLRLNALNHLAGGIELRASGKSFTPPWPQPTSQQQSLVLYSSSSWLTRSDTGGGDSEVSFCRAGERGILSAGYLLGRKRVAAAEDLSSPPFQMCDGSLLPLHVQFSRSTARVEAAGKDQAELILTTSDVSAGLYDLPVLKEVHYLIDTRRHVIVQADLLIDGRSVEVATFSDFIEVGSVWLARRQVVDDAQGQRLHEAQLKVVEVDQQVFDERLKTELDLPNIQWLVEPLPTLATARQHIADGKTTLADRMVMVEHFGSLQQWDDAREQLTDALKIVVDNPGIRRWRGEFDATSRHNEEAHQRRLDEARQLVAHPQPNEAFLAESLFGQASRGHWYARWNHRFDEADEVLALIDLLQPVADRQPDESPIHRQWQQHRADAYKSLERPEDEIPLRKRLTDAAPWNVEAQQAYAEALVSTGEVPAALDWLAVQLGKPQQRIVDQSLREEYFKWMLGEGRTADLVKQTTDWIGRQPATAALYEFHLKALTFDDQLDRAIQLAAQWLKQAQVEGFLEPDQRARLQAAVRCAHGSLGPGYSHQVPNFLDDQLNELILYFALRPRHIDMVQHWPIWPTGESAASGRLQQELWAIVQNDWNQLSPKQIAVLISHCASYQTRQFYSRHGQLTRVRPTDEERERWRKIADQLRARWQQAASPVDKQQLAEAFTSVEIAGRRGTDTLPLLREQVKNAPAESKASRTEVLFEVLLKAPWTEDNEIEAFSLLRGTTDAADPSARLILQVAKLYHFVDAMMARRQAQFVRALHDQGQLDQLTRAQVARRQADARQAALAGLADRLAGEAKNAAQQKDLLADWLGIEQARIDVRLHRRSEETWQLCFALLGAAPPKDEPDSEPTDDQLQSAPDRQAALAALLRRRALVLAMHLAAQPQADLQSVEHLLKYVDTGISQGGNTAAAWRRTKYQLLITLDRPQQLADALREWIATDISTNPWRQSLALLLAEQGKLDQAIELYQNADRDGLLTASDYLTLAGWHQALNHREAYQQAKVDAFDHAPAEDLSSLVGERNRSSWRRAREEPATSTLDENTLMAFKALFKKSAHPSHYLYELANEYQACRDFRLLEVLPDAVLGRSQEEVYTVLSQLFGHLLGEMQNEATADPIVARIASLRTADRTPMDLRALDLLEVLVQQEAAKVQNQAEPHSAACLAALRRADRQTWSPWEAVRMAELLGRLGKLPTESLRAEQLRQIQVLAAAVPANSRDQLSITSQWCGLLFQHYERQADALQMFETAFREYEQARGGTLPMADDQVLETYLGMLQSSGRYAAAEKLLGRHLEHPHNLNQRHWLGDQLWQLYNHALENQGEVSLGKGEPLLTALLQYGLRRIDAAHTDAAREAAVRNLMRTIEVAHAKKIGDIDQPLRTFAFEKLPVLLKRQIDDYRLGQMANEPLRLLHEVCGPVVELQYILERLEQWPSRLEHSRQNGWSHWELHLSKLRNEAAESPEYKQLEPRLLKATLAALTGYLVREEWGNNHIFMYRHSNEFWNEKLQDFVRTANDAYQQHKESGPVAARCAQYLWQIDQHDDALKILLAAEKDGILDFAEKEEFFKWAHYPPPPASLTPLLESMLRERPGSAQVRGWLMEAYFRENREKELQQLVEQTEKHFHSSGRWTQKNIESLASACLRCKLYEKAAAYFKESIAERQRARPDLRKGDEDLSNQYQQLARAEAENGDTQAAVDAATAAIVCASGRQLDRRTAGETLQSVLESAQDLDDFVQALARQASKTGQDSPIVRKAIGQVYLQQQKYDQAIEQFEIVRELHAGDKESCLALVACYDSLQQPDKATEQLLSLIEINRRDLKLYQKLAERFENKAEAERAVTSIVEADPGEAENHRALAEYRQQQDRWNEAIVEWTQAAELRPLEPTGLIGLAQAQAHLEDWPSLQKTLDTLHKTEWPFQFHNELQQAEALRKELPQ